MRQGCGRKHKDYREGDIGSWRPGGELSLVHEGGLEGRVWIQHSVSSAKAERTELG